MQFAQTATVPELYTATNAGNAPAGRLMYLLPAGTPSPPATIAFADAWSGAGTYLFLAQELATNELPPFAADVWQLLTDPRLEYTRFAWIEPPSGSGLLEATTLAVADLGNGPIVAFDATFGFRNVALELPRGARVTVDATDFEFDFGGGFLDANSGRATAGTIAPPVKLGLAGALQGCLRFQLELTNDDLGALDVGHRWFWGVPPDPHHPLAPAPSFFLASQRFPLFAGGVTVYPSLDPLGPLDTTRTFMAFTASDADTSGGAAVAVPSYLRSTLDDALTLTPLTGSAAPTHFAALVFAANQQANTASGRDPFYLTPYGDFEVGTTRTGEVDLMGGLSGVEYFALAGTTEVVSWFPGGAAYATGFLPGQPAGVTALEPTPMPTTSYGSIGANGATLDYFAQPDQSVLYNYGTQQISGVTTITPLAAVPVQAATLTWPPGANATFPLLAYAGLGGDLDTPRQLEAQVVSPARRGALGKAPPQPPKNELAADGLAVSAQSTMSTTPQGLLASYVAGGDPTKWQSIVLGQMEYTVSGTSGQLLLTNVADDLLSSFQSNKMFLVASDPVSIGPYLTEPNARISVGLDPTELWQFDLDPAQWKQYGTILIVKFFDRSVEELAGQPGVWNFASEFNQGAAGATAAQQQIVKTIDAAKKALKAGDGDYAAFVDAVTSRTWNGIIALSVRSPLADLPSELEGLAAEIDPALFRAHHVAIEVSKISVPAQGSGQPISTSNSSIFGLIDYNAPAPLPPHVADWAFQVKTLKVLFAKSAVSAFSSTIDLQVNTLFGEPATLVGPPDNDNIVELYGVYQKHVVNGKVVESYTFQTQTGNDAVFDMTTSQVLNAVVIQQAQFVTVTSKSSATYVESQFLFWGLIDFKALASADGKTPFDAFSFGRADTDDPPVGLAFGNLILQMAVDSTVTPAIPTFTFDASQLALDIAASKPRDGSLFQHFPVTVARIEQAKQGTSPTGVGFMGVQTPLTQTALRFPWFSLDFDLNLGTPGALAAEAGFVATLTVAWSPATGANYRVFTGLRLPGSSGAKRAVSIESIFDITFKSIEIVVPKPGTFILVLYGIGFKFLSFTFPPSGQVNFALFGDPTAGGKGDTSLGWYAAYAKSGAKPAGGGNKQLPAQRPQLGAGAR